MTLTGSVFGLHYDVLLAGLFGGLIALMHIEPPSKWMTGCTLASSAVLGAVFSPVAVAGSINYLEWMGKIPADALRLASACAIGLFGQVLIPLAIVWLRKRGERM